MLWFPKEEVHMAINTKPIANTTTQMCTIDIIREYNGTRKSLKEKVQAGRAAY